MAEEKKESEGKPRPVLWSTYLGKEYPFEHEVVFYHELHPELQHHVDMIRGEVRTSRISLLNSGSFIWIASGMPKELGYAGIVAANPLNFFNVLWTAAKVHDRQVRLGRNPMTEGIKSIPRLLSLYGSFLFPYLMPTARTLMLGPIVRKIRETGRSPFNRGDAPDLLKKYHFGIVDEKGNIILVNFPDLSKEKGGQKIRKWFGWHAQRTRFRLQTTPPKAKAPAIRRLRPALAKLGATLAIAPVKIRS